MRRQSDESVRVFAPAKINWVLTIRGRRDDGYHDLDTVFQALEWGDELICRPTAREACVIRCARPDVPTDDRNLIARAWRLMRTEFPGRVRGLEVELIKRLPAGGGLGGGSSDAVAALRAIDRLYRLRLAPSRLEALAARIGSDCPFFVRGGTQIAAGRGERLRPIPNRLPPLWLVVVWPGFPSATAAAYSRVRPEHYVSDEAARETARALAAGDLDALLGSVKNIFSFLVSESDVRYKHLHDHIINERLTGPWLAGSGSSMFALATDHEHGRRAAENLSRLYPIAEAVRLRPCGVQLVNALRAKDNVP